MSPDLSKGLTVVRRQIDELETLEKQTLQDLNTVAGTERIAKWKARTVALLTNTVGHQEGHICATSNQGHRSLIDLVEEFTDLVECYRTPLSILAKRLAQAPPTRS